MTAAQLIETVVRMHWGPGSAQSSRDFLLQVDHLIFRHSNLAAKEDFVLINQQVLKAW